MQKFTKMQKKFWTVLRKLHTTVHKFFFCSLRSEIICPIYTFKFVSPPLFLVRLQAIESQQWYFAWTNKSRKTIHFVLESQGKVREYEFCRVVGAMERESEEKREEKGRWEEREGKRKRGKERRKEERRERIFRPSPCGWSLVADLGFSRARRSRKSFPFFHPLLHFLPLSLLA